MEGRGSRCIILEGRETELPVGGRVVAEAHQLCAHIGSQQSRAREVHAAATMLFMILICALELPVRARHPLRAQYVLLRDPNERTR